VLTAPQTLLVGEVASASANGFDQADRPFSLGVTVWASSAPGIATVSATGVITARAPGTSVIGASSGGVTGDASIVVIAPASPAASVSVTPASASVFVGESTQFFATFLSAAGAAQPGRPVSWSSSNPAIATVSESGLVRGVDVGEVVVTATIDGLQGTVPVSVTGIADSSIQILVVSPTIEQTVTDTLRAAVTVASARPLRRVFAAVGSRQIPLAPVKIGPPGKQVDGWGADVDIAAEPAGASTVVFSAFDADGHFWSVTAAFEHTPPRGGSGVPPATGFRLVAPPPESAVRVSPRRVPNPANTVTPRRGRPSK
jgi:hypothetical protein